MIRAFLFHFSLLTTIIYVFQGRNRNICMRVKSLLLFIYIVSKYHQCMIMVEMFFLLRYYTHCCQWNSKKAPSHCIKIYVYVYQLRHFILITFFCLVLYVLLCQQYQQYETIKLIITAIIIVYSLSLYYST